MTTLQRGAQRGMVLISSMLLLLVVTIMALAIFRNSGVEERIAGNQREKERALHAAESAQQYAEWWLSSGLGATTPIACISMVAATTPVAGQVCANTLPTIALNGNVANLPWQVSGANVGVTYAPPNMILNPAGGVNTYSQTPVFYISYLGLTADSTTSNYKLLYQVDAAGYGGSANAVAVVESTYYVTSGVCNLGAIGGC
ncbi:MAG TPA: PilX N-terminal domain-containing pilus assembly protein [Steroidobacteraceae bacterium]|jgi:type IV pilus assembly protein PilX|nr:PilX N-terminal domain-containing pilus assembly protein [Steroidobacteraceae bacterium]